MPAKKRTYDQKTRNRLFAESLNKCYSPDCDENIFNKNDTTTIGEIAHIKALNTGGARYDPNMTEEELNGYDNLILLCPNCHTSVDNKDNKHIYTVDLLKQWKDKRISEATIEAHKNKPLLLQDVVFAISNINFGNTQNSNKLEPFNISNKIEHNNIHKYKYLISQYVMYWKPMDDIYQTLENHSPDIKIKILDDINSSYLLKKGEYKKNYNKESDIIYNHSDDIIDNVIDEYKKKIMERKDCLLSEEDIDFGTRLVIVDAFFRCKILEAP